MCFLGLIFLYLIVFQLNISSIVHLKKRFPQSGIFPQSGMHSRYKLSIINSIFFFKGDDAQCKTYAQMYLSCLAEGKGEN